MGKRIWQYPEATGITNDDVILLDSPTEGSRSIKANEIGSVLINKTLTERGTFDAADDNVDGYKKVTVDVPYTDVEVASGPVASWDDGEDLPLKSLTCFIEPVQDLHGYDSPWAGGAGKNKLKTTWVASGTKRGMDYVNKGDYFTIDGLSNNTSATAITISAEYTTLQAGSYIMNGDAGNSDVYLRLVDDNSNVIATKNNSFTINTDTDVQIVLYVRANSDVDNLVFKPMVRLSTEQDSSFAPYSNICPISGWDETNVTRCGKNLWGGEKFADDIVAKVPNATKDTTNHTVAYTASNIDEKILFRNFKENTQYSIFIDLVSGTSTNLKVVYKDGTSQGIAGTIYPFITQANKSVDYIVGRWASGSTTINYLTSGLFEGELTASDFEAYNGQTYTIDLDGTRYGGTLDVISGVLTVDRKFDTYTVLDSQYDSVGPDIVCAFITVNDMLSNSRGNGISNYFTPESTVINQNSPWKVSFGINNKRIYFTFDPVVIDGNTLEDINNYVATNPIQVVYPLATPLTIQLIPTQVKSLLGQNNVWADTGDVDVEYQKIWVRPSA